MLLGHMSHVGQITGKKSMEYMIIIVMNNTKQIQNYTNIAYIR